MELGLFYLDNDRLDDAGKLFDRLEALEQPASLHMLGQPGRAVVLALASKAKESNQLFCAVFAPRGNLVGPPPKEVKGKGPGPFQIGRQVERHLAPIKPLLDHPRGRHWLARARWYNDANGVKSSEVPRYLLWRFPLEGERRK
jgi:hypothetical protein